MEMFEVQPDSHCVKIDTTEMQEQYRDKVKFKEATASELIEWTANALPIRPRPLEDIPKGIVDCVKFNANPLASVSQNDDFQLLAYQLLRNDISRPYYEDYPFKAVPINGHDDIIFFIIEALTMHVFSNSDRLYMKLFIDKGINIREYEQKTLHLNKTKTV